MAQEVGKINYRERVIRAGYKGGGTGGGGGGEWYQLEHGNWHRHLPAKERLYLTGSVELRIAPGGVTATGSGAAHEEMRRDGEKRQQQ